MPRVTGIGGTFFRSKDPKALADWYEKHLGVGAAANNGLWMQDAGPSAFSPFKQDTDYFGRSEQMFMLNFRVDDLKGLLAQLESQGIKPVKEFEEYEGIGAFARIEDPEGNPIELWQPSN